MRQYMVLQRAGHDWVTEQQQQQYILLEPIYEEIISTYAQLTLFCFADSFVLFFNKLTVGGNLTLRKIVNAIFPSPVAQFVFLHHILVILTIFQTFSLNLL